MTLPRLRVAISVIVLLAYLLTIVVLGLGVQLRWIGLPDATKVARAIMPLFSGYVAAVIGYYFTERRAPAAARKGRRPPVSVPSAIAWTVLVAAGLACGSVPVSLWLNCHNIGPLALPETLLNVLAGEQAIIAGFVGVLISAMISKERS